MTRSTRLAAITLTALTAVSGALVLAAGAPLKTLACEYTAAFESLKEN